MPLVSTWWVASGCYGLYGVCWLLRLDLVCCVVCCWALWFGVVFDLCWLWWVVGGWFVCGLSVLRDALVELVYVIA